MHKRKRDRCDDNEYDYLNKKLKKLQKRISRCRRRSYSSSDSDNDTPRKQQESNSCTFVDNNIPGCSYWSDAHHSDVSEVVEQPNLEALLPTTPPPLEAAAAAPLDVTTVIALPVEDHSSTEQTPELDASLMEILGEDPSIIKEYGKVIQTDLAIRLNHIATNGLSNEIRKELKDRYLVPSNCKLIKAPILNPEIKASLTESQAKRDKGIEYKQNLTSCALASLSEAITLLLSLESKNPELLKILMDTARIVGDIQYTDSHSRRFFALSTVNKDLKNQLEKTKIDDMLFGSNLSEVLKAAKIINKSGADIRAASVLKTTFQRQGKEANKPLNFKPPPVSRRAPSGGRRGARATNSAPTSRQATTATQHNFTKPSLRQPPARYRR